MPRATWEPPQITADMCNLVTAHAGPSDDKNVDVTVKLPRKTPGGSDGQVVFKKGKIDSWTDAT